MINYYFIGTIFLGAFLLILAIRWKNDSRSAGSGIAGWAIAIILAYLWFSALTYPETKRMEMQEKRYDDSIKIEMKKLEIKQLDKLK